MAGPGIRSFGVIDSHTHDVPLSRKVPALSKPPSGTLPAAAPNLQQMEAARLPDLLQDMDRAGVTASLVVLYEETDEFFRLASEHPGRLFGLAYYDSLDPGAGLERVRALCDGSPALAVGVSTAYGHFRQDPRLKEFTPLYEYCIRRGLPVQVHLGTDPASEDGLRPTAVGVLARTYPGLRLVCRFLGQGIYELPEILWAFSNLFFQVDGLGRTGPKGDQAVGDLRSLVRTVGSHRLMFGSGWQGTDPDYPRRLEMIRQLPWWRRRDVCWRTAARVYGPRLLGR
jgi:predicted TIM-barrel fold metal-dependent hydrolase